MAIDWELAYDQMKDIADDWKDVAGRERNVRESLEALHVAVTVPKLGSRGTENRCKSCTSQPWPCETRQAIDRAKA